MFDRERLESLVDDGWLRSQRHPDADLWIYNYTEKAQWEKHWTPETLACRGLILDTDGNTIARPFGKFFNLGDPQIGALPVGEPYRVTEKLDGSLGILYWLDGKPCIATRGSFISEQAEIGTQMIRDTEVGPQEATLLFEIIYPGNRIVVDYGSRRELVFLTAIDPASGVDARGWVEWAGSTAINFGEIPIETLQDHAKPNSEGFVIAFESGLRVKVKFEEYVRLHRIITGVTARTIWESLRNGDDLDSVLVGTPDEIHDWITATRTDIVDAYTQVEADCRRVFMERPADATRKDIAAFFATSGANTAVLFKMLDGRPYDELIWKSIYPPATRPGFAEQALEAEAA